MKEKFARLLAALALKTAKTAADAASDFYTYQPKEPTNLKELLSQNSEFSE